MNVQREVLEGFICPICFQNLGSMVLLHDHFETAHSDEDRALLNQIKGPPNNCLLFPLEELIMD